jgi:hypothetical protein
MKLPTWISSRWVRWTVLVAAIFTLHSLAHVVGTKRRASAIIKAIELPPLPPEATLTYAHTHQHNLFFDEVSFGFSAPQSQMDEWLEKLESWKVQRSGSGVSILNYAIREWDVVPGVDFSASLSSK